MKNLPKTFLALSVAGFLAGSIIDFGGFNLSPSWAVALPLGAVFFGLWLISLMLEKEMTQFDEEEMKKLQLIRQDTAELVPARKPAAHPTAIQFKEKALLHER